MDWGRTEPDTGKFYSVAVAGIQVRENRIWTQAVRAESREQVLGNE